MGVVTGGGGGGTPSAGAAPFTITETNGTSKGLVISSQGAAGVNAFELDAPHTSASIDGDGVYTFASDDEAQLIVEGTGNSRAFIQAVNTPTVTQASMFAGPSGGQINVTDATNADVAEISYILGVMTALHSAPADIDINSGMACLWFDQTNGASKLMVKAKSANGTVVTGSVALA